MMKSILQLLFSLVLLIYSTALTAQTWNWANSFGSVSANDEARDIATDNQGNTFVTGYYSGTIITPVDTVTSIGNNDIFVAKYDSSGTLVWLRSAGGLSDADRGEAIAVDNSGNVFITGNFNNAAIFDNISVNSGAGQSAIFTAKYDANGVIQWVKTGTNGNNTPFFNGDRPHDIATDNNGNIYIVGQKSVATNFGSILVANPNSFNIGSFFVKYDTNGNEQFGIPINASQISYQPAKISIKNNAAYILYIDYGVIYGLTIAKYSLNGFLSTTYPTVTNGGIFQNSDQIGFAVDNNENFTVYGEFGSSTTIGGTTLIAGSGFTSRDLFLARQNSNGVIQWVKQIAGGGIDGEGGIDVDTAGNVYISGFYNNAISIDSIVLQASGQDIFVAKFSNSGNLRWARSAGSGNTTANSVYVTDQGDAYVTGLFNGTANFDDNATSSSGSSDVFVAKLGCEPRPISEVIGDTLVCLGNENYEAINNSSGNTFLWAVSGGGTVINNGKFATINWTQTGTFTVSVAQTNECGAGEVFSFNVTVKDIPVLPIINGDNTDCLGSATYNVTNNSISDTYNWVVSGGGNLFPLGNTAIVNWAVTGTHTLSVTTANICGVSPTGSLNISISEIPSQPSPIVGNSNVCQSTQTYTVPQVSGVNYIWSLSSGGSISSSGNTATINWTTAGTHTLSVTPSNSCGVGSSRSILVTVTETPAQPSTVVGNLTVCQGLQSYSVVGNSSTSYNWTISGGGNISFNNSNATVNWQTPGTYTMTITPSNVCGIGTPRTVTVTVLNVPNQPSDILGIDTVCIGTQNYSVAPQSGVNYNWQLSGGGTVLPNGNLATINWTTAGTHTITVTPSNSCGSGQAKSKLVFVKNTNAQITTISGEDEPCLNIENYAVPSIAGLTYNWNVTGGGTVTELGNAAFVDWQNTGIYTLSVSTSDGCTNSLTVSVDDVPSQPSSIFGDTTVCLGFYNYSVLNVPDVNYTWTLSGGGILTQSGNAANVNWTQTGTYQLTATPSNNCGLGTPRTQNITVLTIPSTPSVITSSTPIDTITCLSTETYSIVPQSNVTYNFSLSGNGILVQNQNTASISWQTASVDNELVVTTSNICGTSGQQQLDIDVLGTPQVGAIQGDDEVCLNTTQTYIVPLITENTYNWSLSSGGTLTVVNDTAFINWQTIGTHTLTVVPTNICGSGNAQILQITVKDTPTQPIGFTGSTNVCQTLESYSVTAENNVTYNWNIGSGGSISALNNVSTVNWTVPGTHLLSIVPSNECGIGTALNQTVTVQSVPTQPATIVGNDSTCVNALESYSTASQSGLTYNWTSTGGVLSQNANASTVTWNSTGSQVISVAASNICGTSIPATKNITVLDVPTQPTITGVFDVCQNDSEIYIATSNGTNYNWSTTGGTVNGNNILWTSLGNQTLTVTPSNFCGNGTSTSVNVTVETVPNISQNITGDSIVCPGLFTYTLPSVSGVSYSWSISGGGIIQASGNTANINWVASGTYTITVVPSNDCGTGNILTKQITVLTPPALSGNIIGTTQVCNGETETYTVIGGSVSDWTYNWTIDNNNVVTGNNNQAVVDFTSIGSTILTLEISNQCGTTPAKTLAILVEDNAPNISTAIVGDTLVCRNSDAVYTVTGSSDFDYNWSVSGGGTISGLNNSGLVSWQNAGLYKVGVFASNLCGISDTVFTNVTVERPLPRPQITQNGDSLISSNNTLSQWYFNNEPLENEISPSIRAIAEGAYTVESTNICGTTALSNPFNIGLEGGLFLYPNPGRYFLTLRIPAYMTWYSVDAIDQQGREVLAPIEYDGANEVLIDVRGLEGGLYWFRINTELLTFYRKVIILD